MCIRPGVMLKIATHISCITGWPTSPRLYDSYIYWRQWPINFKTWILFSIYFNGLKFNLNIKMYYFYILDTRHAQNDDLLRRLEIESSKYIFNFLIYSSLRQSSSTAEMRILSLLSQSVRNAVIWESLLLLSQERNLLVLC